MLEEIEIFTVLMVDFKSFMDRRSFFVHFDLNVELNNEDLHSHFFAFSMYRYSGLMHSELDSR